MVVVCVVGGWGAMLLSRAEVRVPRRALVFSNLESLSPETMQACAKSDIAHSTLLFANHGGPAAAHRGAARR